MFSFVAEKKNEKDKSVTGTYMNIIKQACLLIDSETNTIAYGNKPHNKNTYIVSDTVQTALRYFLWGYRNQIVWIQGVVPEESYMRRHSKLRFYVLSRMERYVLKHSKLLFLVSEEMLLHYEKKYRIKLRDKSIIMPCFNETEIFEDAFIPKKYESNSFLYVGGMAKWQCFEEIAKVYAEIEKKSKDYTCLFVYTFDKETAETILKNNLVKNYQVDYAPKDELSKKIKTMKYGFVLRENCTVNNVATPTKFSNYLANGIIPIYSDALKSFSEVDKKNNIGVVCNLDDIDNGVTKIIEHMQIQMSAENMKQKCQSIFNDYYCQEKYIRVIKDRLSEF